MSLPDNAAGVLLGLACGDALGRPVEFRTTSRIADRYGTVTDMLGDGTHGQPAGTVTDDTDLTLRIARSLVELEAFDGADITDCFVEWRPDGTLIPSGRETTGLEVYAPSATQTDE